jgi:ADP-heptose:LPS heptosyltransferase
VLHLGYDSLAVHLASHYQKKIVALFPHWAKSSGPYFSRPEDVILFEPDFSKIKPCFSYDDPYRLLNTIAPEDIARATIHLLGN